MMRHKTRTYALASALLVIGLLLGCNTPGSQKSVGVTYCKGEKCLTVEGKHYIEAEKKPHE